MNRIQKEIWFNTCQILFHFSMACAVYMFVTDDFLQNPVEIVYQQFSQSIPFRPLSMPISVHIIYLLSVGYNTVLYFWDPVADHPIRFYHIIALLALVPCVFYHELQLMVALCLIVYIIDLKDTLYLYRYARQFDNRKVILALMKIHHMITILLIAFSWVYGFAPLGICIMFIHDVTDVPMFALRMLRKQNLSQQNLKVELFLALSVICTWLYYRVFTMSQIILSCYFALPNLHHEPTYQHIGHACIGGLIVLTSLNAYWSSLVIIKSIKQFCCGQRRNTDNE